MNKVTESDATIEAKVEQIMSLGVKHKETGVMDILGFQMDRLMTLVNEHSCMFCNIFHVAVHKFTVIINEVLSVHIMAYSDLLFITRNANTTVISL